jgi:hypothetical protein
MMEDSRDIGSFYDRSPYYPIDRINFKAAYGRESRSNKEEKDFLSRVCRNLPYAHRGYVFKDANLKKYFAQQWWYMPDPTWQMKTDDFTEVGLRYPDV